MRRGTGAILVSLAAGLLVGAGNGPAAAASPPLQVTTQAATLSVAGSVKVAVRCTTAKACAGTLAVRVAGRDSAPRSYSLGARRSTSYTLTLTSAQVDSIPAGGSVRAQVLVRETKPTRRTLRGSILQIDRPAPEPEPEPEPQPTESRAYRERNWTPTTGDTCPASLHRTHSVVGPGNKIYPTWHGPTDVDPATGRTCTYGHEHGDDPASSDLYAWVTDFLDEDAASSRGVPFGYVSEALDTYAADRDRVTRHEDNVGHKIIVANNVSMVTRSPRGYLKDADGERVVCDFLMKVHQGTHSADALTNNAHEMLYAARCTDGTEIISSTLTRFGDANEFNRSCQPATQIQTSGSNLPDGFGGSRLIPDRFCVDRDVLTPGTQASSIWALYEVWQSVNRIEAEDGTVLASFDPWFGVRNPARAHDPSFVSKIVDLVDTTWLVDPADGGTAKGYPWDEVHAEHGDEHLAKADPDSPFDGAQRDYYLAQTTLDNADGATTWWSDPYGDHAVTASAPGLVKQLVGAVDNTDWPELERRSFNLAKDYGADNGVHSPN